MDRPEDFRYETDFGLVLRSYDTWEVDVLSAQGGVLPRVTVIGPRLPEASTPARPQWVLYGHSGHLQGQAWCAPLPSQLGADRFPRKDFLYYDEVGNFRITVGRDGVYEIRNTLGGRLLQVRILEDGGIVELRTPTTDVVLNDDEKSITVDAAEAVTINCKNATVNASENVDVEAGSDATVNASGNATVQAGGDLNATANGIVSITGALVNINS